MKDQESLPKLLLIELGEIVNKEKPELKLNWKLREELMKRLLKGQESRQKLLLIELYKKKL